MPNDTASTDCSFGAGILQLPELQPHLMAVGAMRRPFWIQAISHLDPKYGGLSAAVPSLAQAIDQAGERQASIVGFCPPQETFVPANVDVRKVPLSRLDWLKQRSLTAKFRQWASQSTGLHIHGLWQQSSAVAGPIARELEMPYVVSAHGMLESWAMAHKRWKKALYMSMVEGANLRGAACLHALTAAEADDYRRLHLTNPIAVIPNGVSVPEHLSPGSFLSQYPDLAQKKIILFLGRIHYKKGLDILLKAWSRIERSAEAQLVLAGPDFEGTQQRVQALVDELRLRDSVTFTGMLQGTLKWSAVAASCTFVLPSYSEGLSVSVLEAMGAGKPVIISDRCNLPEVEAEGAGWVIPAESAPLESALHEALRSSNSKLQAIGLRGKRLVSRRYTWPVVGRQMNSLYRWLEGGDQPDDVDIRYSEGVGR